MKITQEADYALRMVCLLAEQANIQDVPLGAPAMAEAVVIPQGFAMKILRKLSLSGLVKSSRGIAGGYRLAVDANTLTVRAVIEVIDGPIEISKCLSDTHQCLNNPTKSCCRFHHVFGSLNDMLTERLSRLTIAMMVDRELPLDRLLEVVR